MPEVVPFSDARPPLTLALWVAGVLNRWRTIVVSILVVGALAAISALVLPPVYRVTVSFAPNPSSSSKLGGAIGSSLSSLSGISGQLGGLASSGEPTESPAFYGELLQSRELLTRLLLTRFRDPRPGAHADSVRLVDIMKLRSNEEHRRIELGVKALTKSLKTESDIKTNLIKLTVDDRYPDLAAREANVALALVNSFNLEQRASRARGKRLYLQARMQEAQADLARAQSRYRDFLSSNRQWKSSPTLSSDQETLQRAQDVASDLYLSVEKQYEAARLDEFNDAAIITVVDSAVAPTRTYWPRATLLVPGAILLGLFIGVMIAGIATVYTDWSRREPAAARELEAAVLRRGARKRVPPVARRA